MPLDEKELYVFGRLSFAFLFYGNREKTVIVTCQIHLARAASKTCSKLALE